jgi:hypothetical protein
MSKISDRRKHRIERCEATFEGVDTEGNKVTFTYTASEQSVYEQNCPQCGTPVTRKGVLGAILDHCHEGLCRDCHGKRTD